MLIGCDDRAAIARMVVVVWLDEAVFGKAAVFAVGNELLVGPEEFRLVLEQIYNFHGRAGVVVVINLGRVFRGGVDHAFVDALVGWLDNENVHAHLAKRSSIVRESSIADSGAGDGREPSVENRKFTRQGAEYG